MSTDAGHVIRPATANDAAAVARIYNHYVLTTRATFETEAVSDMQIGERIGQHAARLPWLLAERDGKVLGYAYAAPWSARPGYRTTVETTVYVDPTEAGRGVGRALYARLITLLEEIGIHTAVGVIALPNPASVGLHEKLGFRKAGEIIQAGRKLNQWVDVGYWQLMLSRNFTTSVAGDDLEITDNG